MHGVQLALEYADFARLACGCNLLGFVVVLYNPRHELLSDLHRAAIGGCIHVVMAKLRLRLNRRELVVRPQAKISLQRFDTLLIIFATAEVFPTAFAAIIM